MTGYQPLSDQERADLDAAIRSAQGSPSVDLGSFAQYADDDDGRTRWDGQSPAFADPPEPRPLSAELTKLADRLEAENAVIRAQLETHHVANPASYTPDFLPVCPPPRAPK